VHETIASPLEAWASFYVIVGSSAGALTGLQFVVMTLIAQNQSSRGRAETISAFATPNVVHFCAALLVASILSVPWGALGPAGVAITGCGVLGVIYSAIVLRRAARQGDYEPVLEDWLWHTLLPALAYGALLVAGLALGRNIADALFFIGGAALLLVFIGIHNAWDTVTYVMARPATAPQAAEVAAGPAAAPPAAGQGTQRGDQV
jgi:hypothetical protein